MIFALLSLAQLSNAQLLDEMRQAVESGRAEAVSPLVERLQNPGAVEAGQLLNLLGETMPTHLPLRDRPALLAALRAAMPKFDAGLRAQARLMEGRTLEEMDRHEEALKIMDEAVISAPEKLRPVLTRYRDQLGLIGKPAPAVLFGRTLGTFSGLDAWRGKVVVVDFFAHWCKPCIAEFPEMKELRTQYAPKGFEILGATGYYGYYGARQGLKPDEEFAAMQGFYRDKGLPWPVAFVDPAVNDRYGVMALPTVAVIDRKGILRGISFGASPANSEILRTLLKKLIEE